MKDLIQEGRKIQETFKKNVATKPINEGFLYNMFQKLEDKLDTKSGSVSTIVAATLISSLSPFALPIGLGVLASGLNFNEVLGYIERHLSDKHYDKSVKPIIQKCIQIVLRNPEVQRLVNKLTPIMQQKKNAYFSNNRQEYERIQNEFESFGKNLDDIVDSALDTTLSDPNMLPLLRKMKANPDSFKGNPLGKGGTSPSEEMSDDELKNYVKRNVKYLLKAEPSQYSKIQSDVKDMSESVRWGK